MSTQSGTWGNAATWGGAGVPTCGDDAIIANGHTVTFNSNVGGLGCNLNITINNGGILDLGGFELNFSGNNTTFTNNGTFTNSGAFNRLRSENGGANFTFAGQGIYSGNLKLYNNSTNWNIAAGTTFTFNSASNNANIQVDSGSISLNGNNLVIIAPSAGANYVIFDKQGGSVNGPGTIQTQGNVRLRQSGGPRITVPVETVSGAAQGEGYFGKGWTVDTGASLSLSGPLTVSDIDGGSGLIISNGASVDLAGNELDIAFNGAFTNNGTANNSGVFSRIVFMDNGSHAFSGVGTYSGNVGLQISSNTINVAAGSSITFGAPAGNTNIQVDSAILNFTGPVSLTLSGQVLNNGTLNMNSGGAACDAATRITIRSSVTGTQRPWNGNTMSAVNVDVKDQAGSATVNTTGSVNAGNNGPNWTFASPCASPTPTPTPTATATATSTPTPTATATATATPTATATATSTPTATPTATATATPTATATATPTSTPTATPTATPSQLLNIATRMRVQTGENVLIGGIIITGSAPKKVIVRGIGPSLSSFFTDFLANPTLELFQGNTLLQSNDDWKTDQRAEIEATGIPPTNDLESAIVRTLAPGNYTAILRGKNNGTGIGVVEAYDLAQAANSKLANIATRGFVETGNNVMIGGLIVGPANGANVKVVVRAIGPSLGNFGIAGAVQDPTLDLVDANGVVLRSNDNWRLGGQQAELIAIGLQPSDDRESALIETVAPGAYTAIVRGSASTTGVSLVEVYNVP